jgi:hypothetical protein
MYDMSVSTRFYVEQTKPDLMRFGVIMAVHMEITVFWDVMPCSLVESYHTAGTSCLQLKGRTLKITAAGFSEMLV